MSESVEQDVCKLKQVADELLEKQEKLAKLKTDDVLDENIQKLSNCIFKYMSVLTDTDVHYSMLFIDANKEKFVCKVNIKEQSCKFNTYMINLNMYAYLLGSVYDCATKQTKYYSRIKIETKELFDAFLKSDRGFYSLFDDVAGYKTYKEYKNNNYYCKNKKYFNEWHKQFHEVINTYKLRTFPEFKEITQDEFNTIVQVCHDNNLQALAMTKEDKVKLLRMMVVKMYNIIKEKTEKTLIEIKNLNG